MAGGGFAGPGAGGPQGGRPLVSRLTARDSQVAVIGGDVHGDVIFGGDLSGPADHVLDFGAILETETRAFAGRRDVFAGRRGGWGA